MSGPDDAESDSNTDDDASSHPSDRETLAALPAGAALYQAGEYHAAHDPWESVWLTLPDGADERLFHGLIQVTAAIYHAGHGNWSGAGGLAESAVGYLDGLAGPDPTAGESASSHRGVAVAPLIAFCQRLAADPRVIERREPPPLRIEGEAPTYGTLSPRAVALAAEAIAEEYGYDASVVTDAAEFARADRSGDTGETTFTRLLRATLDERGRAVAFDRLTSHVERRRQERADLDGLFE